MMDPATRQGRSSGILTGAAGAPLASAAGAGVPGGPPNVRLPTYMTFTAGWLSVTALVFLIAINAIANGCRVAAERDAELGRGTARAARQRRRPQQPVAARRGAGPVLGLVADP